MKPLSFKYRILVVDNEPLILETSALVLKEQGYEVRTAADGFGALVNFVKHRPI